MSLTFKILEIDNEADIRFALIDFINHIFIRHLLLTPKDKTVIIAEPLFLPLWFRRMLLNVLFVDIQVGNVFIAPASVFAMFGLGWWSGLVVDCDAFETTVLPVYDSIPIVKAVKSAPIGYAQVVDKLRDELSSTASWPSELLRDEQLIDDIVKKASCFVDRYDRVLQRKNGEKPSRETGDFVYPSTFGGKYAPFTVPGSARESLGEPLFDVEDDYSIQGLILQCLEQCPVDLRKYLSQHIILTGCCATLPGFGHRLCKELEAATELEYINGRKVPEHCSGFKPGFQIAMPPVPTANICWFGASVFGNLEVATQRAITKEKFMVETVENRASEFNSSKVLSSDWLNTPTLLGFPLPTTTTATESEQQTGTATVVPDSSNC